MTCGALPVLRRETEAPPPAFRLPAGAMIAATGAAVSAWLLTNSTLREARDTGLAAAVGWSLFGLSRILHARRGL